MPSADQVPVDCAHSTMQRRKWVVLIAGSTGSALLAVRPFQPSHHADGSSTGATSAIDIADIALAWREYSSYWPPLPAEAFFLALVRGTGLGGLALLALLGDLRAASPKGGRPARAPAADRDLRRLRHPLPGGPLRRLPPAGAPGGVKRSRRSGAVDPTETAPEAPHAPRDFLRGLRRHR